VERHVPEAVAPEFWVLGHCQLDRILHGRHRLSDRRKVAGDDDLWRRRLNRTVARNREHYDESCGRESLEAHRDTPISARTHWLTVSTTNRSPVTRSISNAVGALNDA